MIESLAIDMVFGTLATVLLFQDPGNKYLASIAIGSVVLAILDVVML